MSNSGAQSSLVVEAAERTGAKLATLSDTTVSLLRGMLDQPDIANPLDTKRTIPTAQYVACLDALVNAPEVDIVLVSEELPFEQGVERRIANLRSLDGVARRATAVGKTVAMFTPFLTGTTEYGRTVRADLPHVPILRETERTLRVMHALAEAADRPIQSGDFFSPPADTDVARFWRKRAAEFDRPTALNEVESKLLLRAYGIPMPPERLVQIAAEADAAARDIEFPVVLKAVSTAIAHKSDAGLVILDVADSDAVRQAVSTLTARASALPAPLDGILVAKQMSHGTETVLGIKRDVEMGPAIMFGMGGIWVELFRDVSFAPASLNHDQALAMVRATRVGRLLEGFRGRPPGDIDALCDALVHLAQLACDLSDIVEAIDINPFLVCERGRGGYALDGLVVLRPPARASREIEP
jgi:acetyltransferase